MRDVHGKLNPGLSWQKQHSTRMRLFSPPNCTSNLREQLVQCCIGNLALYGVETWWEVLKCGAEKYGDQVDRSCKKWRNMSWSNGGQEYPTCSKMEECWLDWSHLVQELPSKTRYWRKYIGKNWRRTRWRLRQLLDDLKETMGLKEEALDRILWWTRNGWGHSPVVRQDCMKVYCMGLKSGISGPREGHCAGDLCKRFWECLYLRNNRIMQTVIKCRRILYFYWIF
jgi:hypothetical protein